MAELQDIIDGWSDEEIDANPTDVVYIPPETVDEMSEEETLDDDQMPPDNEIDLFTEMPGTFEIEYDSGIDTTTEPPAPKKRKLDSESTSGENIAMIENHKPLSEFGTPKWRKPVNITYSKTTEAEVSYEKVDEIVEKIGKQCAL